MWFWKRKPRSQRASKQIELEFADYSLDMPRIHLYDRTNDVYYIIEFESDDEINKMLSVVASARHNLRE